MNKILYVSELKEDLSSADFISLRNLYTPIVGVKSIMLYSLIYDNCIMSKKNKAFRPIETLYTTLDISLKEMNECRLKLEAVGLLRTFERSDSQSYIFKINKPLSPKSFKSNSLLFSRTIEKIGELSFENIYFALKEDMINKDEYNETTIKFQDIFDFNTPKNSIENTLEINVASLKNKDEAIKGLLPTQFIYFLTHKKCSPSQVTLFQRLSNTELSSEAINHIIDYSFSINGKIVNKHIEVIANDLINKNIIASIDVQNEMINAKKAPQTLINELCDSEPQINKSSGTAKDWDDIFNSLGGEL